MVKKVSIWLTLDPLLYSGEKHLAEIARELHKPHTTVRKQLAVFEKLGLVDKRKVGRQKFYKIKKVPLLIDYLTIIEKERLVEKCNKELILKEIVEEFHNFKNKVVLFGSAVYSAKKANDIDLLVIGNFNEKNANKLEKMLNIKIHMIRINHLEEVSDELKEEIRKKHLLIQGSEDVIRWLIS